MHSYSDAWLDTFLFAVPTETTEPELAFLERLLPAAAYPRLLDVCCGAGRHTHGMAALGHAVTGVDNSMRALRRARQERRGSSGGPSRLPVFVRADMRALPVAGPFDAAIIMWQSFGQFDDAGNTAVLRSLRDVLRPGGRLVLDIYDRRFFETRQGRRTTVRDGMSVTETKGLDGNRLHVELQYDGSAVADRLEWRVYEPDEIVVEAEAAGFDTVLLCSGFNENQAPDPSVPRMQVVVQART